MGVSGSFEYLFSQFLPSRSSNLLDLRHRIAASLLFGLVNSGRALELNCPLQQGEGQSKPSRFTHESNSR